MTSLRCTSTTVSCGAHNGVRTSHLSCTDRTGWDENNIACRWGCHHDHVRTCDHRLHRVPRRGCRWFHVARIVFPPELTLPLHSHPHATVAVILRGAFEGTTRGASHPCPTGSMLTEPAGEDHGNRFAPAGATVFVVQPDPARAELLEPFAALLDRFDYQQNGFVSGLARRASNELNAWRRSCSVRPGRARPGTACDGGSGPEPERLSHRTAAATLARRGPRPAARSARPEPARR